MILIFTSLDRNWRDTEEENDKRYILNGVYMLIYSCNDCNIYKSGSKFSIRKFRFLTALFNFANEKSCSNRSDMAFPISWWNQRRLLGDYLGRIRGDSLTVLGGIRGDSLTVLEPQICPGRDACGSGQRDRSLAEHRSSSWIFASSQVGYEFNISSPLLWQPSWLSRPAWQFILE